MITKSAQNTFPCSAWRPLSRHLVSRDWSLTREHYCNDINVNILNNIIKTLENLTVYNFGLDSEATSRVHWLARGSVSVFNCLPGPVSCSLYFHEDSGPSEQHRQRESSLITRCLSPSVGQTENDTLVWRLSNTQNMSWKVSFRFVFRTSQKSNLTHEL